MHAWHNTEGVHAWHTTEGVHAWHNTEGVHAWHNTEGVWCGVPYCPYMPKPVKRTRAPVVCEEATHRRCLQKSSRPQKLFIMRSSRRTLRAALLAGTWGMGVV